MARAKLAHEEHACVIDTSIDGRFKRDAQHVFTRFTHATIDVAISQRHVVAQLINLATTFLSLLNYDLIAAV